MELRQLDHFVAVADELSFTQAARRVHVVQSALSTSVAKLERELGVELFDRTRQQISLTAAGERFRTHAQDVLRAARTATESVDDFRGTVSGTVEFGSLISFGPVDVARALGDFHRAHPFVRLRLRLSQSGASAYLAALIEGSLDLALVSVPNRFPPQLQLRLMFEEPMMFVCRADHPVAQRKRVDIAELATEELVGFPPEFGLRGLMDGAFHAAGVQANTLYEVPAGFPVVADLVANGLGTAFMPRSEARRFSDLTAVALQDPVVWQVYIASPPTARMSPATARLAATLLDEADRTRR
ncbi:LysR substrate-binding domain-containing protein [Mycobacterium sp. 236(2023)]|uniref:LysR substrate-binding domain-containing protein n=1 Tax=Mycobacterium sp. 236(2023) TaxID=3038163 RepID=UPI00241551C4|nr:LysR substrate-binding domain-containing protein [Mycobacterium sp. 236(2023)]MDG4667469.1 LysR substrate-binding domain-containing protein [Mycobacterium sp. 236(2023)]